MTSPTAPHHPFEKRPSSGPEAHWATEDLGFWRIATNTPERTALIAEDGTERSFGELLAVANQIAHTLRSCGLARGDCISALLPNDWHYYAIHLAAMQSGIYLCPLNHHLTASELAYILEDSNSKLLIAHARFASRAAEAAETAGLPAQNRISVEEIDGFIPLDRWIADASRERPEDRSPGQLMAYTSGTTGRPKGVRRKLVEGDPDQIAAAGTVFARAFGLVPFDGMHLVVGPLYHAGPSVFSWGALHIGHTQVLTDRFDAEKTLRLIDQHRVTNTHLVATMFHRLLALPAETRQRYDVSSLRMVCHSAAPTPVDVKQAMFDWWGPVIWETYGGTEGAATIAKPHHWLAKPGTVGRPVRGVTLSVLDEEGQACPARTPGSIYIEIAGSGFEYWKDGEKTRAAHRNRSFTLGDVGYVDEEGFLFLTGRQSEVIISGGVNIYPAEVENVLLSHPSVLDVAVIGVPDEEWGERVLALVQPTIDAPQGDLPTALIDFCRDRIAHFKCPRHIEIRDSLPRSENGKLYRRELRDPYWASRDENI